jgi:hypothetical protein
MHHRVALLEYKTAEEFASELSGNLITAWLHEVSPHAAHAASMFLEILRPGRV